MLELEDVGLAQRGCHPHVDLQHLLRSLLFSLSRLYVSIRHKFLSGAVGDLWFTIYGSGWGMEDVGLAQRGCHPHVALQHLFVRFRV